MWYWSLVTRNQDQPESATCQRCGCRLMRRWHTWWRTARHYKMHGAVISMRNYWGWSHHLPVWSANCSRQLPERCCLSEASRVWSPIECQNKTTATTRTTAATATATTNYKSMFTFVKVIQGKLYAFFQTRCISQKKISSGIYNKCYFVIQCTTLRSKNH